MATLKSINPVHSESSATPQAVEGWASTNWKRGDAPAVIVNQNAEPLTLVSWAIGQLEQLGVSLEAIHCSSVEDLFATPQEIAGMVRQPLDQALAVLNAAAARMLKERATHG